MTPGPPNSSRWIARLAQAVIDVYQGASKRIYHEGRSFFVTGADLANGRLIRRIAADRQQALAAGKTPPRLVSFRAAFRSIAHRQRIAGLVECLNEANPEIVRLAIWLIARAHTNRGAWAIGPFRQGADVRVRRETARGLRRLGAWTELRTMAQHDPDPRVRRLATATPPRPFDQRFEQFAGQVKTAAPPDLLRRSMSLFVRLPVGPRRPAKTPEFIRAILERIRWLLRGR